ncbi:MAG: ankyrin repeat domain-containing protein [Vicinamibacteraceae bacterium]
MVRRGCTLILLLFGGLFALYFAFFTRYFEWPGNLFAAGLGSLFGAMGLGAIGNLLWAWRDTAAFRRAARKAPPVDGTLVVVAGRIRPLGAPLTSPLGARPCAAYEYEVVEHVPARKGHAASKRTDLAGFGMAACVVETPDAAVRLLGFPLLDEFPQSSFSGPAAAARARQYAATTSFETMHGLGAFQMLSSFDDALADADGAVRKDFRMNEAAIPFEHRTLGERIVEVGQDVCALGRYDAEKRALVPRGATLNRLWPGSPAVVRRLIVSKARSQAVLGLSFFAVSHAMLGGAFYLSETRYAREPEASQASAIRSAVQDGDVAALERVVRQGANPDARDASGDAVLLDVREPAIAAALVRLGASVDVRHRDDGDTPLIRAARMGIADLVRVLLAAHADMHARTTSGDTALSEAIRGGHEEVAALLRAAGADRPEPPVEREPADVERRDRRPPR